MTDTPNDAATQRLAQPQSPLPDQNSIYDLRRVIKEVSQEVRKSKTPIFIALLAAFLALVSMVDEEAGKKALVAHIEASNQFAYYQAKNIRLTSSEIAAGTFESMGKDALAAKWQEKADRYSKEKKEILSNARAEQKKRSVAIRQGDYYSVAIALLQISIVLASVSLISGGWILLGGSITFSLIAVFFVVNGYGLYYEIPTDPEIMMQGVKTLF